jgi:hypothetical protein
MADALDQPAAEERSNDDSGPEACSDRADRGGREPLIGAPDAQQRRCNALPVSMRPKPKSRANRPAIVAYSVAGIDALH